MMDKRSLQSSSNVIFSVMFTVAGTLSAVITAIGDQIHYMNRDIKTYVYVAEGIVGGLVLLASVILILLTKL